MTADIEVGLHRPFPTYNVFLWMCKPCRRLLSWQCLQTDNWPTVARCSTPTSAIFYFLYIVVKFVSFFRKVYFAFEGKLLVLSIYTWLFVSFHSISKISSIHNDFALTRSPGCKCSCYCCGTSSCTAGQGDTIYPFPYAGTNRTVRVNLGNLILQRCGKALLYSMTFPYLLCQEYLYRCKAT